MVVRVSELKSATINGWEAMTIESSGLAVTVLPERGAEIHRVIDKVTGIDILFHAPWGLPSRLDPPRAGSDGHRFLERYAGGWQELFPSTNDPCIVAGQEMPLHGEVAAIPWRVTQDGESTLVCVIDCATLPLRLERQMTLDSAAARLTIAERVTNCSSLPQSFTWGHHCVIGPPFLEAGCRLETAARRIVTIDEPFEETARLAPGQSTVWPLARLRDGGTTDLRDIPGPEVESHDDIFLTDLTTGSLSVTNPRLGRRVCLEWDAAIFPWITCWQPFGGAHAMPLTGTYALGIEPWSARDCLEIAAPKGDALILAGQASLETALTLTIDAA